LVTFFFLGLFLGLCSSRCTQGLECCIPFICTTRRLQILVAPPPIRNHVFSFSFSFPGVSLCSTFLFIYRAFSFPSPAPTKFPDACIPRSGLSYASHVEICPTYKSPLCFPLSVKFDSQDPPPLVKAFLWVFWPSQAIEPPRSPQFVSKQPYVKILSSPFATGLSFWFNDILQDETPSPPRRLGIKIKKNLTPST